MSSAALAVSVRRKRPSGVRRPIHAVRSETNPLRRTGSGSLDPARANTKLFGHEGVAGEVEDSTRGRRPSVGCLPAATSLGTEWAWGWHVPITRQVTLGGSIRISASRRGMVGRAARGKLGLPMLRR
jgi:hypothetical protein